MPLVAAPGDFVDALPGTQGLPPVVQQLGHEVSPMATPGLVVARVRSVEQSSSGSIPAPAQRRGSGRTAQRQATASGPAVEAATVYEPDPIAMPVATTSAPVRAASSSSSSSTAPVVARSAAADTAAIDGADEDEIAVDSAPAPEMTPVRSLPTVSRSAIRIPDRPLTSAASVVRPAMQRTHAGQQHQAAATEAAPAAALPAPS